MRVQQSAQFALYCALLRSVCAQFALRAQNVHICAKLPVCALLRSVMCSVVLCCALLRSALLRPVAQNERKVSAK